MSISIILFGLISSLYLRGNFSVAVVALLQKKVSIAYSNDMITLEQAEWLQDSINKFRTHHVYELRRTNRHDRVWA